MLTCISLFSFYVKLKVNIQESVSTYNNKEEKREKCDQK